MYCTLHRAIKQWIFPCLRNAEDCGDTCVVEHGGDGVCSDNVHRHVPHNRTSCTGCIAKEDKSKA